MNKSDNKKLFQAIEENDWATVEMILEKNPGSIDVYGTSNRNCRDKTPLMYSMQCQNFDFARRFIARGANVNAKMDGGPKMSVIALAAKFGNGFSAQYKNWIEFSSELIKSGANPTDGLWTALANYSNEKPEMIRLLIESGADIDSEVPAGKVRELVKINKHLYSNEILKLCGVEQ